MKKLLLQLTAISCLSFLTYNTATGQCSLTLNYGDTTLCQGDSTTITAVTPSTTESITTTFAAGNNHRGNMFDIVATNQITIESVDAHPVANTTIEIYYKVGTFAGFENNAAAWTLVGSAPVTAMAQGTPTPVPVTINVTIPAGQTYGFYVTSSDVSVSLYYTDGTSQGSVYTSDANMQILEGVGLEYPFTGTPFTPRMWNGNIYYSVNGTSYTWSNGATTPSITVAPSATTTYSVDANINGCPTLTDSVQVSVSTVSADLGSDTTICIDNSITLDAGGGALNTYQWSTAETTQTIVVDGTTQGTGTAYYSVMVSDQYGCSANDSIAITVDPCAGITDLTVEKLKVYPNPASTFLVFESSNESAKSVEIFDLTGALVETLHLTGTNTILGVNHFNNGMYYYKVNNSIGELIRSGKIIVKK